MDYRRRAVVDGILGSTFRLMNNNDIGMLSKAVLEVLEFLQSSFLLNPNSFTASIQYRTVIEVVGMLLKQPPPGKSYTDIYSISELCSVEPIVHIRRTVEQTKKTISICKSKLMPNYSNVVGVPIEEVEKHPGYTRDLRQFRATGCVGNGGLDEGDVYNTLVFDLWYNIREVKWLLYERDFVSFEEVIHHFFLEDDHPSFDVVVRAIENNADIGRRYPTSMLIDATRYGLLFMENYKSVYLPKQYRPVFGRTSSIPSDQWSDLIEAGQSIARRINGTQASNALRLLGEEAWISFLKDSVTRLRATWYGTVPHLWGAEVVVDDPRSPLRGTSFSLTRKVVYSFAKALAHRSKDVWTPLGGFADRPTLYGMLSEESREIVTQRFLGEQSAREVSEWLSCRGFLEKNSITVERENMRLYALYIVRVLVPLIPQITYRSLAAKGVLSMVILPPSRNPFQTSPMSFISHTPETELVQTKERADWQRKKLYLNDWLSQISLYHRLLHTRIMFLSGATGTGKSSQVPKLLLYATSAILYNMDARLVCSQPRIEPTTGAATRISQELGIPINDTSATPYFRIQYSHSNGKYLPTTFFSDSFMRVVTDGTLLENIIGSPCLIETATSPSSQTILTGRSAWDVVLVDEAHEHNRNIDLILTLMREVLQNNPWVTLVILSATMDADEDRYRTFYRVIDDNVKVPFFSSSSSETSLVDRRVHFGRDTNYAIRDIYRVSDEYFDYKKIEALGIEKVLEYFSSSADTGDVLLFSIGEFNIREVVSTLNESLPPDAIAVPYFSRLPDAFRSSIMSLRTTIRQFRFRREDLMNLLDTHDSDWDLSKVGNLSLPSPFKRAVVVATNMAEASITIDSLRLVVDTGFAKKNRFDATLGGETLSVKPISESSRIQRRGRVGRQAPGTVIYLYPRGSREGVPENYGMTNDYVYESLLSIFYSPVLQTDVATQLEEYCSGVFPDWKYTARASRLTDLTGSFYLIHPDEGLFERHKSTKLPSNTFVPKTMGSIHWIHELYQKIPGISEVLYDPQMLSAYKSVSQQLRLPQLSLLNIYSMTMAWFTGGKDVLELVTEYIVVHSVQNKELRPDWGIQTLKSSLDVSDPDAITAPSKLGIEDLVAYCTTIIILAKLPRNTHAVPQMDSRSQAYFCLYFSHPLSLAIYEGNRWVNAFSKRPLNPEETIENSAFGYYACREDTPSLILPLNKLCFHYIINGYRSMGSSGVAIYS